MYDETIQHALRRLKTKPLSLPAPHLEEIIANLQSPNPVSEVITGTAGDGKTYRCREVWLRLGGDEKEWLRGKKVQTLSLGERELVVVKDLSELLAEESTPLLKKMAEDVASPTAKRVYLIAANHGQLLEKLKLASSESSPVARLARAIEERLFRKPSGDDDLRLELRDLSRARAMLLVPKIIDE